MDNKKETPEEEILEEEYRLGKEYYQKLIEESKEEANKGYK